MQHKKFANASDENKIQIFSHKTILRGNCAGKLWENVPFPNKHCGTQNIYLQCVSDI